MPFASHINVSLNLRLFINEKEEINKVLERINEQVLMLVVGSLIYVMVYTQPNIVHSIGVVSQFLLNPRKKH